MTLRLHWVPKRVATVPDLAGPVLTMSRSKWRLMVCLLHLRAGSDFHSAAHRCYYCWCCSVVVSLPYLWYHFVSKVLVSLLVLDLWRCSCGDETDSATYWRSVVIVLGCIVGVALHAAVAELQLPSWSWWRSCTPQSLKLDMCSLSLADGLLCSCYRFGLDFGVADSRCPARKLEAGNMSVRQTLFVRPIQAAPTLGFAFCWPYFLTLLPTLE